MRAAGMNDVLSKPLQLDRLQTILGHLDGLRQPVKSRSKAAPVPVPQFHQAALVDADQLRSHFAPLAAHDRRTLEETVIADLRQWTMAFLDAVAAADERGVNRARHTLKGICAAFGAVALWDAIGRSAENTLHDSSGGAAGIRRLLDATIAQIRVVAGQPDRRTA